MSDLRTRIAAALKTDLQQQAYTLTLLEKEEPYSVLIDGTVDLLEVADAVIAEIGLRHESRFGIDEPGAGYTSFSRYVTDWTVDE